MSDKLANAPIFYTTAQIRFNPVLDMAEYVGALQKKWRSTYPDFSAQTFNQFQLQLPPVPGKQPDFKINATPRWNFKDTEQTSGIVLSTDSITFHTTAYSTSEEFFMPLLEGLAVVHEVVSLSYIESVAMRTLDAIIPDASHELPFFLHDSILGLSSKLQGKMKHSFTELVVGESHDQLTVRIVILPGRIGVPADLAPITLTLPRRVTEFNSVHAVLDNDCVQKQRFHFDLSKTADTLKAVKKRVTDAFKKSVTQEAIDLWRQR